MEDFNQFVGGKIRFFRKLRNKTLQDLAEAIGKSKATVSKYEKSEIALDVEVLYDIATALDVSIGQLTDYPRPVREHRSHRDGQGPFARADQLYIYTYDGKAGQIMEGRLCAQTDEQGDRVELYMDILPDAQDYRDCRSYYQGKAEYHTSMLCYVMENQSNQMEQILLYVYNPIDREEETSAMLCGLSRLTMQPVAMQCLVSLHPLKKDEELRSRLVLDKQDISRIRKINMFVVDNQFN